VKRKTERMNFMKLSLDELERREYQAGPGPGEYTGTEITLDKALVGETGPCWEPFSLNGSWEFLEQEEEPKGWENAFPGEVPCTVHTALWKAGRIPDPMLGRNQAIGREHSYRTWWLRRRFAFTPKEGRSYRLCFEGVADCCTVWLNGQELCSHKGMFGGPDVDVTGLLREENQLVVKLEPIPFTHAGGPIPQNNSSWRDSVVINNMYGWHYFCMPPLGVYRPVYIVEEPPVELGRPFAFTRDLEKGQVGLVVDAEVHQAVEAQLEISVKPHNFQGESLGWRGTAKLEPGAQQLRYEFAIPEAKLWWPNGFGEPNLYDITVTCQAGGTALEASCLFGLRTIQMEPLPGGPSEELYNWSFVINGRTVFIKGTNWCTMDAMLNFDRAMYQRFITLAREQNLQLFRAWGAGMPETDDFYELCSENGIMVIQEWPTAWNSHRQQPYPVLEDTIRRATLRTRSFPALVMYGGGNESSEPWGEAINMMGRLAIELDGTRPFHRGEPWGGSTHDYLSYWDDHHVDHHLTAESPFWGEYGFASAPAYESVLRYLPKESQSIFPLRDNPDFVQHTPTFGYLDDMNHIMQSANYFLPKSFRLKEFVTASQLIQALGVRRVIDRSRARNPQCAGVVYYKMNDNSPAVSWSTVDYYGAPKLSHYVIQDSFAPQSACVLFERTNYWGIRASWPVYLLDDTDSLPDSGWTVEVKAYDGELHPIAGQSFSAREGRAASSLLGRFTLTREQTETAPLLVVCSLRLGEKLVNRCFYFCNFEAERGCIFRLPRASVRMGAEESGRVTLENVGQLPAVGATLTVPGRDYLAGFSDNFLWLEPGEKAEISVTGAEAGQVELEGLNLL